MLSHNSRQTLARSKQALARVGARDFHNHHVVLNTLSSLPFDDVIDMQDNPHEHVFGMMNVGNDRAAVVALPYYLPLVEARKYLLKLDNAIHESASRLEDSKSIIIANRAIRAENLSIMKSLSSVDLQIQSLRAEVRSLRQSITAEKTSNSVLTAKNTALSGEMRLQQLRIAASELVFEVQRLMVVYLGHVEADQSRAADFYVDPMLRAMYTKQQDRDAEQSQTVASLQELITKNHQSFSPKELAQALIAFKAERFFIAPPVDKKKTISQCESDLFEYVRIESASRTESGDFRNEAEADKENSCSINKLGCLSQSRNGFYPKLG